jgi:hypothetical protein
MDPYPFPDLPLFIQQGNGPDGEPAPLPVVFQYPVLENEGLLTGHGMVPRLYRCLSIVGMHSSGPAVPLVVAVALPGKGSPTRLLACHFASGIVGPENSFYCGNGSLEALLTFPEGLPAFFYLLSGKHLTGQLVAKRQNTVYFSVLIEAGLVDEIKIHIFQWSSRPAGYWKGYFFPFERFTRLVDRLKDGVKGTAGYLGQGLPDTFSFQVPARVQLPESRIDQFENHLGPGQNADSRRDLLNEALQPGLMAPGFGKGRLLPEPAFPEGLPEPLVFPH